MARSIATEMHGGFAELRNEWPMNLRRKRSPKPLQGPARDHAQRVEDFWRRARAKFGQGGPFLFGHFTAADAMYAPVVTRFDTYGGQLAPDTRDYCDAVLGTRRNAGLVRRGGGRTLAGTRSGGIETCRTECR